MRHTAPGTSTSAGSGGSGRAALTRFYDQRLSWGGCGRDLQCAGLTVPVDYSRPAGRTLRLAVIRHPATGSRRGSLVVNPGGPGGSGVGFVREESSAFSQLTDHFDLVSFDPRGVGESHPIRCLSGPQLDAYIGTDPAPTGRAGVARSVRQARRFAAACLRRNGSFLGHVGTIDQARDMDVLRAALGDRRLTYYGASYGTYLGAKYAQLFPTRIRAMVLDGAVDPALPATRTNRVQAEGFETDLRDFLTSCVRSGSCPLGGSDAAATGALDQLIRQVRSHPEVVGSRRLGPGELFEGLAAGLYNPGDWTALAVALAQARAGNGATMLVFSDALTGRHSDGSYSNLIEANNAINCIDRPWPRSVSTYVRDARRFSKLAPHFGAPVEFGSLTCAFWPVQPVESAHPVHAPGAPPILVIGTTRDPATPYAWARALAAQLSSGVLLTFDSDGHTAYTRGNPCVMAAVKAYVESRTPPAPGTRCS